MLPDYYAFIYYRKCFHCFTILGDNTKLPILDEGTAVFSLNGKTIMVRDAIHVPDLRAPLYSPRKYKTMLGCSIFSLHDVGSYILFPNFALRIDDIVDNLVSYKSIGRSETFKLDYAQPRASRASSIILPPPPPPALIKTNPEHEEMPLPTPLTQLISPSPPLPPAP